MEDGGGEDNDDDDDDDVLDVAEVLPLFSSDEDDGGGEEDEGAPASPSLKLITVSVTSMADSAALTSLVFSFEPTSSIADKDDAAVGVDDGGSVMLESDNGVVTTTSY